MAHEQLKSECAVLVSDIKKLSIALKENYEPIGLNVNDDPENSIRLAKERRLLAEIETLNEVEATALNPDRAVQFECLEEDIVQSIKQLEVVLTCVQSEERKLLQDIEKQKTYLNQHTEMDGALSQKLQKTLDKEQDTEASIVAERKRKTLKARKYHDNLMKEMAHFVNEHFPAPRRRNLSGPHQEGATERHYDPMLSLVEALMNQCVDSPHDPYLHLTQSQWPPHVEQLLRHNVAQRHPDDQNRIKLLPFHL